LFDRKGVDGKKWLFWFLKRWLMRWQNQMCHLRTNKLLFFSVRDSLRLIERGLKISLCGGFFLFFFLARLLFGLV